MTLSRLPLVTLLSLVVTGISARADEPAPLPAAVNIRIESAVIAPGKSNHAKWDGLGAAPNSAFAAVATAVTGSNPYTAVLGALAQPALSGTSAPEVFGSASFSVDGNYSKENTVELGMVHRDTYTPSWGVMLKQVPLTKTVRVRIKLLDMDLAGHDPIGTAEIGYADLVQARQSGKIFPVNVADQTGGQLLFVAIGVYPAEESKAPATAAVVEKPPQLGRIGLQIFGPPQDQTNEQRSAVMAAQARMMSFMDCYESTGLSSSSSEGTIVIRLIVGPDGKNTVATESDTFKNAELRTCLEQSVQRIKLQQPTSVPMSFSFHRTGRD